MIPRCIRREHAQTFSCTFFYLFGFHDIAYLRLEKSKTLQNSGHGIKIPLYNLKNLKNEHFVAVARFDTAEKGLSELGR